MSVAEIIEQVKALTLEEQQELKRILLDLLDEPIAKQRKLSELRGLGKDIWQGIDAQTYVDQLRDEWIGAY